MHVTQYSPAGLQVPAAHDPGPVGDVPEHVGTPSQQYACETDVPTAIIARHIPNAIVNFANKRNGFIVLLPGMDYQNHGTFGTHTVPSSIMLQITEPFTVTTTNEYACPSRKNLMVYANLPDFVPTVILSNNL